METHFGSTIEKIRLQKGIPINQFIQGIMDASTYHRFKTGKIDTTITKFTALLNRLNVRFESSYLSIEISSKILHVVH